MKRKGCFLFTFILLTISTSTVSAVEPYFYDNFQDQDFGEYRYMIDDAGDIGFTKEEKVTGYSLKFDDQKDTYVFPRISIRFDDGWDSNLLKAAPIMANRNIVGTDFEITDSVGDTNSMNWTGIQILQNNYNWEIGSHTKSHPSLASDGLSSSQLHDELGGSKAVLESHGLNVYSLAYPGSDYNNTVKEYAVKYYYVTVGQSGAYNTFPYNFYKPPHCREVTNVTSVATVESWIDQAINNNGWIILLFHRIVDSGADYSTYYLTADFEDIMDYIETKVNADEIEVVTVYGARQTIPNTRILNTSFESLTSGWANNWTRSNTQNATIDTNSMGSYPSNTSSLYIKGSVLVRSNNISLDASRYLGVRYSLGHFLNLKNYVSGALFVYVEAFDENGTLVDKTEVTQLGTNWVGWSNSNYTLTGSNVSLVREVRLLFNATPYSGLPVDYDLYIDQIVFGSYETGLVLSYDVGETMDEWTVDLQIYIPKGFQSIFGVLMRKDWWNWRPWTEVRLAIYSAGNVKTTLRQRNVAGTYVFDSDLYNYTSSDFNKWLNFRILANGTHTLIYKDKTLIGNSSYSYPTSYIEMFTGDPVGYSYMDDLSIIGAAFPHGITETLLPLMFGLGVLGLAGAFAGPLYAIHLIKQKKYYDGFISGLIITSFSLALLIAWLWQ